MKSRSVTQIEAVVMASLMALVVGAMPVASPGVLGAQTRPVSDPEPLEARIWFDRGVDPELRRGDRVRVYYRVSQDAYLAIVHIDTDGTVRMLYPRSPWEARQTRRGQDYRLLLPESPYWFVDDQPGIGYFFLIALPEPLDFEAFSYSSYQGGWNLAEVGRQVYSDPYVAMDDYVAALIPDWESADYALDFAQYDVGGGHQYPRFMCYECHGFQPYYSWNPYHYACTNFRVVIYTDPYYYPSHRYRGNRVVFTRPIGRGRPQFEFKERGIGERPEPLFQDRQPVVDRPGIPGDPAPRRSARDSISSSGRRSTSAGAPGTPRRGPSGAPGARGARGANAGSPADRGRASPPRVLPSSGRRPSDPVQGSRRPGGGRPPPVLTDPRRSGRGRSSPTTRPTPRTERPRPVLEPRTRDRGQRSTPSLRPSTRPPPQATPTRRPPPTGATKPPAVRPTTRRTKPPPATSGRRPPSGARPTRPPPRTRPPPQTRSSSSRAKSRPATSAGAAFRGRSLGTGNARARSARGATRPTARRSGTNGSSGRVGSAGGRSTSRPAPTARSAPRRQSAQAARSTQRRQSAPAARSTQRRQSAPAARSAPRRQSAPAARSAARRPPPRRKPPLR